MEDDPICSLMRWYKIDRDAACKAISQSKGNSDQLRSLCQALSEDAVKNLEVPTKDTRGPPEVSHNTRIIGVLGIDEPTSQSTAANPLSDDGWMVSDFYLWIHLLHSMGASQEWIASTKPSCLIGEYEDNIIEDSTTLSAGDAAQLDGGTKTKPEKTKRVDKLFHGDSFEERVVVLDKDMLEGIEEKVTIRPEGKMLKEFFLDRLDINMERAKRSGDKVLMFVFAHGNYHGVQGLQLDRQRLVSEDVVKILGKYPSVPVALFMTSCFSGHWVTTPFFKTDGQSVSAAAEADQESFGCVWSISQRHGGGRFPASMLDELTKEPTELPSGGSAGTTTEYQQSISKIRTMNRLCLPRNRTPYGSAPIFKDADESLNLWHRTGYPLDSYEKNYDQLKKIPALDPFPVNKKENFNDDSIDDNDPAIIAWKERHPSIADTEYPEATAGYGATSRGITSKTSVLYLANMYLTSLPENWVSSDCKSMLNLLRRLGENDSDLLDETTMHLRRTFVFRVAMNDRAQMYADALHLYRLPPIKKWPYFQGTFRIHCNGKDIYYPGCR